MDISKGLSEDEWSEMIQLACANASDFSGACSSLIKIMNAETRRAFISMDSQKLSDVDKKLFEELMDRGMTHTCIQLKRTFRIARTKLWQKSHCPY